MSTFNGTSKQHTKKCFLDTKDPLAYFGKIQNNAKKVTYTVHVLSHLDWQLAWPFSSIYITFSYGRHGSLMMRALGAIRGFHNTGII